MDEGTRSGSDGTVKPESTGGARQESGPLPVPGSGSPPGPGLSGEGAATDRAVEPSRDELAARERSVGSGPSHPSGTGGRTVVPWLLLAFHVAFLITVALRLASWWLTGR